LNLPVEADFSVCEVWQSLKKSALGLLMPVIILSGVVLGVFTATEAAAVAVVYGIVVAKFVYRELRWRDLVDILINSGVTTGIVMIIVGTAAVFAWLLTSQQVPLKVASAIASLSSETWVFLIIVNLVFLVLGCFFEVAAILIMALPILFPITKTYGVDPVHFGMILVANLGIGMVTPPVGMCLYVACSISGVSIQKATPPLIPLIATMIASLFFITYVPSFTLLLPRLVLGYQSP
jgi:C4-dicarboxylate transporter DctM subunit